MNAHTNISAHTAGQFLAPYAKPAEQACKGPIVELYCCDARDIGDDDAEWMRLKSGYYTELTGARVLHVTPNDKNEQWVSLDMVNRIVVKDRMTREVLATWRAITPFDVPAITPAESYVPEVGGAA